MKFQNDHSDRWFLDGPRINVTVKPKPVKPQGWWSVTSQGNDSRIFVKDGLNGQNPSNHRFDLGQADTQI